MSTTAVETSWTPETQDEKDLKKSFLALATSPEKAIIQVPDGEGSTEDKFILRSRAYYDVQAYVLSGKTFPQTKEEFQVKMPAKAFRVLTDVEPEIYERTRDTIVGIANLCQGFFDKSLTKMIIAAKTAMNYSRNTIDLLEKDGEISLKSKLEILMNPKYKCEADVDDAFRDAREGAQMALEALRNTARESKKEMDTIVQELQNFKYDTMKYKQDVGYLKQQYQAGPVKAFKGNDKTYLVLLDADLAKLTQQLTDEIAKADKEYERWETCTKIAVGAWVFGVIGVVVTAIKASEAASARKAWNILLEQIEKFKNDKKEVADLILFVQALLIQFQDIEDKMGKAIDALSELSELFGIQADSYDAIAASLDRMKLASGSSSAANRKAWIVRYNGVAVKNLQTLGKVASEFYKTVIFQDTLNPRP